MDPDEPCSKAGKQGKEEHRSDRTYGCGMMTEELSYLFGELRKIRDELRSLKR